jgi:FlaA1/EpsC-like NDP-sugar epimerase
MWNAIKLQVELPLYSDEMTRFFLTVDEAIDLIDAALNFDGINVIPNAKSAKILDLFEIFHEKFGLKYKVESPRAGEKIHEIMASSEEVSRMQYDQERDLYIMHPKTQYSQVSFPSGEYSSDDVCISKEELEKLLEKHDFFRQ